MFDRSNTRKRGFIWDHGSVNTVYHDREGMAVGVHGHMDQAYSKYLSGSGSKVFGPEVALRIFLKVYISVTL